MNLASRVLANERMETDCADYQDYAHCLSDLTRVNRLTLTHRPMLSWLARETRALSSFSLLDVGSGQGDALRLIHRAAARQAIQCALTGIDLHPWSTRAARAATPDSTPISYLTGDVFTLPPDARFDFIISSQLAHHLDDSQVVHFIRWMEDHARLGWFIGDLHRHQVPYLGFPILAWAAGWHRFVRHDGQVSIGRSFVRIDWLRLLRAAGLADNAASIHWHVPFRLCVSRRCDPR